MPSASSVVGIQVQARHQQPQRPGVGFVTVFHRVDVVVEQLANLRHCGAALCLTQGDQRQRAGMLHLFLLLLIPHPDDWLHFDRPLDFQRRVLRQAADVVYLAADQGSPLFTAVRRYRTAGFQAFLQLRQDVVPLDVLMMCLLAQPKRTESGLVRAVRVR